jgi:hypothetical protein
MQVSRAMNRAMSPLAQQARTRQTHLNDYEKRLQSFGDDYQGAKNYASEFQRQNQNQFRNFHLAEGTRRANENYFKRMKYDYSTGNYDDWKKWQDLKHKRNWTPNTMYAGGGYDGYSPHANAKMLQKYNQLVAGDRATRFASSLPQYIEGETSGLRQALGEKMGSARKNLLADMNRRGLLRSGQRGQGEVDLASQFAGQFEQGRADIYKNAQAKAQELFTNPALRGLGYDARNLDVQNRLLQMKENEGAARSQLFGGAMGLIGEGIGNYYGNKTPVPKTNLNGFERMP